MKKISISDRNFMSKSLYNEIFTRNFILNIKYIYILRNLKLILLINDQNCYKIFQTISHIIYFRAVTI